jgi:lipid-binding SYLF domain-containing protein
MVSTHATSDGASWPAENFLVRTFHCRYDSRVQKFKSTKTTNTRQMKNTKHPKLFTVIVVICGTILAATTPSTRAASAAQMDQKSRAALQELYAKSPAARRAGHSAVAVLVFPEILKAGFIFGAQHGDGALIFHGDTIGYYKTVAASYGLQAGVQRFGFALFFMTNSDLAYLHKSGGWEIGTGPNVTIVDAGMAKSFTTTTLRKGVYAFAFGQKGLMAGLGLQGSKITQIHPR